MVASFPVQLNGVVTGLVLSPLLVIALRVVLRVRPLFGSVPGHVLLELGEVGVGMNSVELVCLVEQALEGVEVVGVLKLIVEVFDSRQVDRVIAFVPAR